jgi:hypothetical protein
MNERAIRWAWCQSLPPTHKLVLLALAGLADAAGQCSPSISSLAALCSVSTRTVRRALRDLEADSLLTVQTRLRPDGAVTSNQYALAMTGGHTMSPALDTHVIGPGHLMAEVDVKAGPVAMVRIGIATHQSATGAVIQSKFAGHPVLMSRQTWSGCWIRPRPTWATTRPRCCDRSTGADRCGKRRLAAGAPRTWSTQTSDLQATHHPAAILGVAKGPAATTEARTDRLMLSPTARALLTIVE